MSEKKQIHALVSGRVQGVGYRYFVQKRATRLQLVGQVRNLGDGRVEVVAEGDEHDLQQLIQQLQQGPSFGYVQNVEVHWLPAGGTFQDFDITY
jgi:acylphosphatase